MCIDFITNGKRNTSTFACTGETLIPLPQRQSPRTLSVSRKHSATCILEQWLSCLTGAEAKVKTPFDSEFVFRLHPHSLRKETRSGRRSCQEKRLLLMWWGAESGYCQYFVFSKRSYTKKQRTCDQNQYRRSFLVPLRGAGWATRCLTANFGSRIQCQVNGLR